MTMPSEITLEELLALRDRGEIEPWARELKTRFEQFVGTHRGNIGATTGLFAVVDVTDFLLRVIEDDCLADPAVRSGEDRRVEHYLNVALATINAPDAAAGIAQLNGAGATTSQPVPAGGR
ncbi:hypothetical protein [Mycolicibacterium fortuitum]|uniref:hypothetical protein n=1 Tax=Mycolicibacterium fortuitum TaxID=1766 RepID=UPI0026294267|nr:hypothetical protein [Mycolicibacterium fortuitum]